MKLLIFTLLFLPVFLSAQEVPRLINQQKQFVKNNYLNLLPPSESANPFRNNSIVEFTKEIEQLREAEIGWRKIPWKTCLLDGITTSRKENKPIVLWIFIDLPFDDKRC